MFGHCIFFIKTQFFVSFSSPESFELETLGRLAEEYEEGPVERVRRLSVDGGVNLTKKRHRILAVGATHLFHRRQVFKVQPRRPTAELGPEEPEVRKKSVTFEGFTYIHSIYCQAYFV